MKRLPFLGILISTAAVSACGVTEEKTMTVIDPGHYHASLIQKNNLKGVSQVVKVYAPAGMELDSYLATVDSFNSREESPTSWKEELHVSEHFLDSLPPASKGDFVVLAGKNRNKSAYIKKAIECGYSVLSDKPMAISSHDYEELAYAYDLAESKGLAICDLMTERYDVLNAILRRVISDRDFFGKIENVSVSSVHHFYKEVSGTTLKRPAWYYDVTQQGEGIADVTTHLLDLIFWQCFPGQAVAPEDITNLMAFHYPTPVSQEQYEQSTGISVFPDYLSSAVDCNGLLQVMSNGWISFLMKGIPVRVEVRWDYEAPTKSGDTSESSYIGEKASVQLVQNARTGFNRQLSVNGSGSSLKLLAEKLAEEYEGLIVNMADEGTMVLDMPQDKKPGHEEHFNMVAASFLSMIDAGKVPVWEKMNTLTKYKITTSAVKLSSQIDE